MMIKSRRTNVRAAAGAHLGSTSPVCGRNGTTPGRRRAAVHCHCACLLLWCSSAPAECLCTREHRSCWRAWESVRAASNLLPRRSLPDHGAMSAMQWKRLLQSTAGLCLLVFPEDAAKHYSTASPMRALLQSIRVLRLRTTSSMAQIWTRHSTRRSSKLESLHVAALNDAPASRQQRQATRSRSSAKLLFLLKSNTNARVIVSVHRFCCRATF